MIPKACMHRPRAERRDPQSHDLPRVPGERAPSFSVPGLLNSLPRLLLSKAGPFARFLRNMLDEGLQPASTPYVWPCPLPYPEVFRRPCGHDSWRLILLNLCVAALSWLYLGKPVHCPREIRAQAKLNKRQAETVRRLRAAIFGDFFPLRFSAGDLGRHAAKVEGHSQVLGALARAASALSSAYGGYLGPSAVASAGCPHPAPVIGTLPGPPATNARPIQAARIKLPGPPRFKPEPFLDPRTRHLYEHPLLHARAPLPGEAPPPVRILAKAEERLLLYRALADSERLVVAEPPPGREKFGAGLFCVPKSAEKDRLILDARPANSLEEISSRWTRTLASASAVTSIILEPGQILLLAGADLKDCFYQFQAPPGRIRRNLLADDLSHEEAAFVFRVPVESFKSGPARVHVAFSSLAMGDCAACEVAQCAHLGVCLRGRAIHPGELLVHAVAPPRGLLSVGLVIDDLIFLEKAMARGEPGSTKSKAPSLGRLRLDAALKAYREAPLKVSDDKVFCDATKASFWGITVHGESGWVRPNPERLWPLVLITSRVIQLGLTTAQLLESLVGSWLSVFLLRRRLLASMVHVFSAVRGLGPNDIIRLSPELAAELASFMLIGPLACVCLRAPVEPSVTATDASSTWQAAVRAPVPVEVATEGIRQSVQKGAWTRLLGDTAAWLRAKDLLEPERELPEGTVFSAPPLYVGLACYPAYSELWRREYRSRVHINIAELEAYLREEARAGCRKPCHRFLFGIDSQVALGAVVKGRSASPALNELLSRSIAPYVGFHVLPHLVFFPTAVNPADAPTRHQPVAGPTCPAPRWWAELCTGRHATLDKVTRDEGFVVDGDGFSQDDLFELGGSPAPALHSNGFCKRSAFRAPRAAPLAPPARTLPARCGPLVPASAQEKLREFPLRQFVCGGSPLDLSRPGALDLFSGAGGVARGLVRHGCPWVLTFDACRSVSEDLSGIPLQCVLLDLVRQGAFCVVGGSPPCASFSRAVAPPLRSAASPGGLPHLAPASFAKVSRDNRWCVWLLELKVAAEAAGVLYWFENPDLSFLWRMPGWEAVADARSDACFRVDRCLCGCPWRKRTRIAINAGLAGARLLCSGRGHRTLRGYSKAHRKPWTLVSQNFPRGLCELLALSLCAGAGWTEERALDRAACAKLPSCCRIGEASHPGPRRPSARPFVPGGLAAAPLHSAASSRLGFLAWSAFLRWVRCVVVSSDPVASFVACPALLAMALRSFGDHLFQTGGSLQQFRYAVVAAQRLTWGMRGQLGPAWEMVSRWERLQPVVHRTPVPEILVKALVALAWSMRMRRWAVVTLIAFYGLARIGEVIKTKRQSLLLPPDHLGGLCAIFVKLEGPKTAGRGGPRTQHLRVDFPAAVELITAGVQELKWEDPVYPFGPATYRRRWDMLLETLGLDRCELTPGGLRGGGAVWAYHHGTAIADIQWRMRLKHQHTLVHYLQEVAALNALLDAGPDSRVRLRQVAELFPFVVLSC